MFIADLLVITGLVSLRGAGWGGAPWCHGDAISPVLLRASVPEGSHEAEIDFGGVTSA
jgi:hypothetical protein